MATPNGKFEIEYVTRLCKVNSGKAAKFGYFHCWEHYADVIAPGLTIGSHPGGQYGRVFGIVEFEDGVKRVDPPNIKFIDEPSVYLVKLNEMNEEKEKTNE